MSASASPSPSPRPAERPQPTPPGIASSALFRLPHELRLQIYQYVLSAAPLGVSFPQATATAAPRAPGQAQLTPQLLRVHSAVHAEAVPVLYGRNKLIFSHPSDANVYRHAIADPRAAARYTTELILRVKSGDVKLWTAYFNSNTPERSLSRDFPHLRRVGVRFRGLRYSFAPVASAEHNVVMWLSDARLSEVILSVRKCVADVRIDICVKVPGESPPGFWDGIVAKIAKDHDVLAQEHFTQRDGYVGFWGVWIKVETEGT